MVNARRENHKEGDIKIISKKNDLSNFELREALEQINEILEYSRTDTQIFKGLFKCVRHSSNKTSLGVL